MFIGLCGLPGSGVEDIASFLINEFKFDLISLDSTNNCYSLSVSKYFPDSHSMLSYVTSNWKQHFVIINVSSLHNLDLFLKRPFFLLITVDASLMIKYNRHIELKPWITLEEFCKTTDMVQTYSNNQLLKLQDQAQLKLINNTSDNIRLSNQLLKLNILDPERLRPAWDSYFMNFADLAAHRSNCMKRRVGCVLVRDNRVVATGYNGTPRGFTNCNNGGCVRCNSPDSNTSGVGLSTCLCLHAEENALLEAGRSRVEENCILYCNTCPCLTCSIKIVQVGIMEVVYSQSYSMDDFSAKVFREAGIKFRQFLSPTYGTVILE